MGGAGFGGGVFFEEVADFEVEMWEVACAVGIDGRLSWLSQKDMKDECRFIYKKIPGQAGDEGEIYSLSFISCCSSSSHVGMVPSTFSG